MRIVSPDTALLSVLSSWPMPPPMYAQPTAGPPEDAPEVEVRLEDQQQINEFGRLNARLHEVQDDLKVRQQRRTSRCGEERTEEAETRLVLEHACRGSLEETKMIQLGRLSFVCVRGGRCGIYRGVQRK